MTKTPFCYAEGASPIPQNISPSSDYGGTNSDKKNYSEIQISDKNLEQNSEYNDTLLKDIWGIRPWLAQQGITFSLVDVNELWGNPTGGTKKGAAYEGLTTLTLDLDPEKIFGIKNGQFNISALQIRGRNFSSDNLGTLNPVSGIEADRSTRLWELWYQQGFLDNKFDIRIGKISLDQEFLSSSYASMFLNASFGWPMIPSLDLYGGGSAYPLAAPAIRFRFQPNENWTDLLAISDDNPNNATYCNPSGPFNCDPQMRHKSGSDFNFTTGVFAIEEIQYHLNPQSTDSSDPNPNSGLAGNYRLGVYFDSGAFPDQRYNRQKQPLGSANAAQTMFKRRGNWSVYGVIDQAIWQSTAPSSIQSIGVFGRLETTPSDRNSVDFTTDAGMVLKGIFGRDDDSVGLGWGFGRVGARGRAYDRDYRAFTDPDWRVRGTEHHFEAFWQIQATPWLLIQPDFQYMFNPGAGIVMDGTNKRIPDEAVFGLHTSVNF